MAQPEIMLGSLRDLRAAAVLMRESWGENRESALDYDESFLGSCLEYPERPILAPAMYCKDVLVAMVCGLPRNVVILGKNRRLVLMTFLTVAPQWKGLGLGRAIWAACIRQAREAGFDGAIHYCAQEHVSNHVTVKAAVGEGLSPVHIMSVRFLHKVLKPSDTAVGQGQSPSVQDFLEAADVDRKDGQLTRLWSRAEAEWEIQRRARAFCMTERIGSEVGALAGYYISSRDASGTRCLMIEDVLWHRLAHEQQLSMLRRYLAAGSENADIAVVPVLGYVRLSAFNESGFRLSRRVLNAYLTMWNGDTRTGGLRDLYLDVL